MPLHCGRYVRWQNSSSKIEKTNPSSSQSSQSLSLPLSTSSIDSAPPNLSFNLRLGKGSEPEIAPFGLRQNRSLYKNPNHSGSVRARRRFHSDIYLKFYHLRCDFERGESIFTAMPCNERVLHKSDKGFRTL